MMLLDLGLGLDVLLDWGLVWDGIGIESIIGMGVGDIRYTI